MIFLQYFLFTNLTFYFSVNFLLIVVYCILEIAKIYDANNLSFENYFIYIKSYSRIINFLKIPHSKI